jgi:hypothetical protein
LGLTSPAALHAAWPRGTNEDVRVDENEENVGVDEKGESKRVVAMDGWKKEMGQWNFWNLEELKCFKVFYFRVDFRRAPQQLDGSSWWW